MKRFLFTVALLGSSVATALGSTTFVGKGDWLFYVADGYNISASNATEGVIEATKAIENTGTKVMVVIIPLKMRIFADKLPDALQLTKNAQNQYQVVLARLKKAGIDTVDLDSAFLKYRTKADSTSVQNVFFRNDTHWTPYGSLVAAQAIADHLKDSPPVKTAARAEYAYKQVQAQWNADLPRFLWSDLQKEIPPETYVDYQYHQVSGEQSLLGEGSPKIAVIGTSYTGPAVHFADALQMTLKTEIVSFSTPGGMVERSLPEYLKSATYKENKPNLLIWEIPEGTMWASLPTDWLKTQILPYLK